MDDIGQITLAQTGGLMLDSARRMLLLVIKLVHTIQQRNNEYGQEYQEV